MWGSPNAAAAVVELCLRIRACSLSHTSERKSVGRLSGRVGGDLEQPMRGAAIERAFGGRYPSIRPSICVCMCDSRSDGQSDGQVDRHVR